MSRVKRLCVLYLFALLTSYCYGSLINKKRPESEKESPPVNLQLDSDLLEFKMEVIALRVKMNQLKTDLNAIRKDLDKEKLKVSRLEIEKGLLSSELSNMKTRMSVLEKGPSIFKFGQQQQQLQLPQADPVFLPQEKTEELFNIIANLTGHIGVIDQLSIDKSDHYLASVSYTSNSIKIWNMDSFKCIQTIESDKANATFVIVDNMRLVVGFNDGSLQIWSSSNESKSFELTATMKNRDSPVKSMVMRDKFDELIVAHDDSNIDVWDCESQEVVKTMIGHKKSIISIQLHSSGDQLVSLSSDRTVKLWDLENDTLVRAWMTGDDINAVTANDEMLFAASSKNEIKVWSIGTGELVKKLTGHTAKIVSLAVDSDNEKLYSVSVDDEIRIWSIDDGDWLQTIDMREEGDSASCVIVLAHANRLIIGTKSGKVIVVEI